MRKTFLEPELEVVRFGTEDIITTSFGSRRGGGARPLRKHGERQAQPHVARRRAARVGA